MISKEYNKEIKLTMKEGYESYEHAAETLNLQNIRDQREMLALRSIKIYQT